MTTAPLGPAMKLARSTTFSPEKMLSPDMAVLSDSSLSSVELWRPLLEEGSRALLLVVGPGAQAEVGGLEQQAFALARVYPLVRRRERELHGDGSVGGDPLQDGFGARDEIGRRHDLVDKPDAMSLLGVDHLARQDEPQGPPLADQTRQPLRAAAARDESQGDLGLAEFGGLDRDPEGAGHGRLAAAAQRKAVDRCEHRLAKILDEIEHALPEAAGLLGLDGRHIRKLGDVGTGNECLGAGARQDDAAHRRIVPGILEGLPQVRPRRGIEGVEDLRAIDRDIGDAATFLIENVCERQARLCCRRHVVAPLKMMRASQGEWRDHRLALAHTKAPSPVMALPTIR